MVAFLKDLLPYFMLTSFNPLEPFAFWSLSSDSCFPPPICPSPAPPLLLSPILTIYRSHNTYFQMQIQRQRQRQVGAHGQKQCCFASSYLPPVSTISARAMHIFCNDPLLPRGLSLAPHTLIFTTNTNTNTNTNGNTNTSRNTNTNKHILQWFFVASWLISSTPHSHFQYKYKYKYEYKYNWKCK